MLIGTLRTSIRSIAPIDHHVWSQFEAKSPIASRLYEFFTFNFAGEWPTLTIDYDKLAKFLPVARKQHLSQIEQQFSVPLSLLLNAEIITQATWQRGKHGQVQLTVRRGRMLARKGTAKQTVSPDREIESTEIHELYRSPKPEDELVCQFHALWENDDKYTPTATERKLAREVIAKYGAEVAEKLLPRVVEIMRTHFPKAKSFGGTSRYWADAANATEHEQAIAGRRKQEFIDQEVEEAKAQREKTDFQRWQVQWDRLSTDEQEGIRQSVLKSNHPSLRLDKIPPLLHRFCLRELDKRNHLGTAA